MPARVAGGGVEGPGRDDATVEPVRGVYGYVANVRSGPLADVRVRTALAMAIDREALVRRGIKVGVSPAARRGRPAGGERS